MTPLTLLFILTFLVSVDVRILAPVLPSISASLGSSPGTIGLAMTTYSLAYGTGQLFYGPLSDRLGRIAVIRAAGVGFSICTILSALSVTAWQFILVRLLAGALAGAVIPLTLVFIGDTVEYERRQAVLGHFAVITSTALAFSASIGGTVSHFVSWRFMLLGYALLALIPLGLLWRLDLRGPGEIEECADRFGDLLRNRYALFVYVGVFLEGFLCWGGMTYLGAFATYRYRLDQFTVGLLIALFGVGMMVGGLLMDRLRRLLSENALAMAGGILMGASFLVAHPALARVGVRRRHVRPGAGVRLPAHHPTAPGHGYQFDRPREGLFAVCLQPFFGALDGQRGVRVAGGRGSLRIDVHHCRHRSDRHRRRDGVRTATRDIPKTHESRRRQVYNPNLIEMVI